MVDWSQLPEELLHLIAEKLKTNSSYLAFRATCKPWHLATREMACHYPHQLPLLLLPYDRKRRSGRNRRKRRTYCAFSLSDNKIFQLRLSNAQRPWFRGSSNGWLFTLHDNPVISMMNPFTRARIELPPLTAFPNVLSFNESEVGAEYIVKSSHCDVLNAIDKEYMRDSYIRKAVISCDPCMSPNYVVIAIHNSSSQLAFCRYGDKEWTKFERRPDYFEDIIIHNEHFYVVDFSGRLSRFDLHPSPQVVEVIPPMQKHDKYSYLVESHSTGKLLQVLRCWEVLPERSYTFHTYEFKVFELDMQGKKRFEVKTLGDCSLFLGVNYSLCLSARDFPGILRNCIYFTDDTRTKKNNICTNDWGVFHLEKEIITPFPYSSIRKLKGHVWPPPLWMHTPYRCNEMLEVETP